MNQAVKITAAAPNGTAISDLPARKLRRWVYFSVVAVSVALGIYLMHRVLSTNGLRPLEMMTLGLFAATFLWIAMAFWSALAGAALNLLKRDPLTLRRCPLPGSDPVALWTRTAVAMPVYNEDVRRVMAGLEAMFEDLARTGEQAHFDFFLLSDSTDRDIAARERHAVNAFMSRHRDASCRLFYRRRPSNEGRKAGNVADFCRRWRDYDHMVLLDADSVMSGRSLLWLAGAMQANPSAGIIQTAPMPVRQRTPFGRGVQFASALYGPLLAAGQSFWQMNAANYWGHNAIIRLAPFRQHCDLPVLPGKPPLGGEILSHDFVEAALMRRAGWDVLLVPWVGGSYEEVPANLLDFARRDRRWSEGNLQHLRLVTMAGLHPLSRVHFLLGAFAYGCSFLWFLMLAVGSADAMILATSTVEYFHLGPGLFPDWPVTRAAEMWTLLAVVIAMLLLPKLFGVLLGLGDRRRRAAFGGAATLCASAFVEMLLSILLAPILMCFHARFVASILRGQRVTWDPQNREGRQLGLRDVAASAAGVTALGLLWGGVAWLVTPRIFWVMVPVFLGLVLAIPLIAGTSNLALGRRLQRWGLFTTPAETAPDPVLAAVEGNSSAPAEASGDRFVPRLAS